MKSMSLKHQCAKSFYLIINQRYGNEMPTIITSNLTLDQVAGNYGDRLASRIAGMGTELVLDGKDRRLQR
jgi:DNA replication protein DnaC